MKTVYKVVFDLKVGKEWLAGGNPNGWSSRHVIVTGDARDACHRVQRDEYRNEYEGKKPIAIRFLSVTQVAGDVL